MGRYGCLRVFEASSFFARYASSYAVVALAGTLTWLAGVPGTAHAQDAYRFTVGPYGAAPGPTSAAACASQPYWPTAAQACQATKTYQPVCDRNSAIYRNHVATLTSPTSCSLSWEYANLPGGNAWSSFFGVFGLDPVCPAGKKRGSSGTCVDIVEANNTAKPPVIGGASCGNPIYPLAGSKREGVETGVSVGWHSLVLSFDSLGALPPTAIVDGASLPAAPTAFGARWFSSLHRAIKIESGLRGARVARGNGEEVSFTGTGTGVFTAPLHVSDRLVSLTGGYRYYDATERTFESYDSSGRLTQIQSAMGEILSFFYSVAAGPRAPDAGYLLDVTDSYGRTVQFSYNATGRATTITDPTGRSIAVGYTGDNLAALTWQDTTVLSFLYENAQVPWALTGVVAEDAQRRSTFTYDSAGRATSTLRAGSANRFSVAYATPPSIVVTDTFDATANIVRRVRNWSPPVSPVITTPQGTTIALGLVTAAGNPVVTSRSQPAGSGCDASVSTQTFDANGNLASRNDFNGNRVCYANDLARNLETVRVEGLAATAACSVTTAGAALPTGSRKVTTSWHPDWRLPEVVAEPGRRTTYVYHGRPDPFAGNAVANCVSGASTLTDGKPLAVLCKMVEQATTDASGASGLAAALDTAVAARAQTWTYNGTGQVLTANGARTDVSDVTTFEYYTATNFTGTAPNESGYRVGDLWKTTNPLGHVTVFQLYNKAGRLLQSQDSNNITSTFQYDARQRNTSSSIGEQTTTQEYWPTGLLKKVTRPDGTWTQYEYDAAQRMTRMSDNTGSSVDYVLDNLGNRTQESVKDPANVQRRLLQRGVDPLGRIDQVTGRE